MVSIVRLEQIFESFRAKVLGSGEHFPLERQVLNAALFASVVVSVSLIVPTIVFNISRFGIIISLSATIVFGTFFVVGRREKEAKWLPWIYLISMFGLVLVDWRYSAGLDGVSPLLLVAFTGVMPLILSAKGRRVGFVILGSVFGIIYYYTLTATDLIPQHTLAGGYVNNLMISIIAVSAGIGIVSLMVINAHRRDQVNILALNDSLENLNERVEERNTKLEIALTENVSLNKSLQDMNETVEERNTKLEIALSEIKTLKGIVPICAFCKKIRNDKGYYESVEEYIEKHTNAEFSHGYCPDCAREHYPEHFKDDPKP